MSTHWRSNTAWQLSHQGETHEDPLDLILRARFSFGIDDLPTI